MPDALAAAVNLAPFGANVVGQEPKDVRREFARIGREFVASNS
jgi:hypothetical protein